MKSPTGECKLGRPRQFDCESALDAALDVFRRKGYEGASLTDLTEAMGINRPSLYAAYGDKEQLFRKALERYFAGPAAYLECALSQGSARSGVERLLRSAVESQTTPGKPAGCLAVQSMLTSGELSEEIRAALIERRNAMEAALRKRLKRAQREGELAASAHAGELAEFFLTVMQGLAVRASGGATRRELERIVDTALRIWPGAK